jgi:hypothetical protein
MDHILTLIYALILSVVSTIWAILVFLFELLIVPFGAYLACLLLVYPCDRAARWLVARRSPMARAVLIGLQVLLVIPLLLIWMHCAAFLALSAIADLEGGFKLVSYVLVCAAVAGNFAYHTASISINRAEKEFSPAHVEITSFDTYMIYLSIALGIFATACTVAFAVWPSVIPAPLRILPSIWY